MYDLRIQVYANGKWYTTVVSTTNPKDTVKQYKVKYDRVKWEYRNGTTQG